MSDARLSLTCTISLLLLIPIRRRRVLHRQYLIVWKYRHIASVKASSRNRLGDLTMAEKRRDRPTTRGITKIEVEGRRQQRGAFMAD